MHFLLTGTILLFIRAYQCEQQLDVLKISNVPFPHSLNPAAWISASYTQDIAEFTLCYRLQVESYNDNWTPVIIAWKQQDYNKDPQGDSYFIDEFGRSLYPSL